MVDSRTVGDRIPRYFGNSGIRCSRKQAPDALAAGVCLTDPVRTRANGDTFRMEALARAVAIDVGACWQYE